MSKRIITTLCIISLLAILIYFPADIFGQTKLNLTSSMLYNFSTKGEPGLLLDEQDLANDPSTGQGGTPLTVFSPGWINADIYYPAMIVVDLGKSYNLLSLWLFDASDIDSIFIYTGDPSLWEKKAGLLLNTYNTWREVPLQDTTRFLMFSYASPSTRVAEIVVYGWPIGTANPPPLPVQHPKPFFDHFMGVNGFIDDPVDKLNCAGNVREYHDWGWDEGNLDTTYHGFPHNQYAWNPSWASGPGWSFNFDDFYRHLKNDSLIVSPDLQGCAPYIHGFDDSQTQYKPISQNENPLDPVSFIEHSDYLFQFAARYGSTGVAHSLLKLRPDQPNISGSGFAGYLENWNEPDKWWCTRKGYFTPDEFSTMCSADYDGHENSLGTGKGMKAADSSIKMVMGGLASLNLEYLRCMKLWCDFNRSTGFPADVLNFHHYSGNGSHGISPEDNNLKQKLKVIVDYRDAFLPGKEIWLSEFGYDTNPESEQAAVKIDTNDIYEVQGQWIMRSYLEAIAAGIDKAFVFMLRDANAANPNKYNSSGLTNEIWNGHQPKKSWFYVSTMKNQLKGLCFENEIASGNNSVNVYKFFSKCAEKAVYAVWCTSSSNKIIENFTLDIGTSSAARLIRPQSGITEGCQSILEIQNNKVTFRVTERPVFISTTLNPSPMPAPAGDVNGPEAVFQGQAGVTYWVNPISNASIYNWILPPGVTLTAGGNTNSITVTFSETALSGNLSVSGSNLCGTGQASPILEIHVIPVRNNVNNIILGDGEIKCYDAVQVVSVAGNGTTFLIQPGGGATFIAGQKILLLPGTRVDSDGWLWAYITPFGSFCTGAPAPGIKAENINNEEIPNVQSQAGLFKVYPNPTNGRFTLELNPEVDQEPMTIFITGLRGEIVINKEVKATRTMDFSIENQQAGIYIIRLMIGDRVETAKIIRLK